MANDVTFQHPDYVQSLPQWDLVEDAAAGERAVKEGKEKYLPKPNKQDRSEENRIRYEQYVFRAVYYNATGRTLAGLSGIAFTKWPQITVPTALSDWMEDVTGSGVPLIQHAQSTLNEVMKSGRAGILVDYPKTAGEVSVAAQSQGGILPTFTEYNASSITNWRTMKVGSKMMLTMVVLRETYQTDNGFEEKQDDQYRVLTLDEAGYQAEIWRKTKDDRGMVVWAVADTSRPTQGNGQPWREIPFQFIGSKRNDWSIDPSPLYDLAAVNLSHYRNSADYEDSCYLAGQPQFWMSGLDEAWVKMLKDQGIYLGSRQILPLPPGGQAGILQAQPNSMPKEAMDQKERQMASLGARLLSRGSVDAVPKTKAEVDSEDATAHSVLSLVCDNVSMAYEKAITWAANFASAEGDVEFSIPTEFGGTKLDAPTMLAMMQAVQQGQMPLTDFWSQLRAAGYIDGQKSDDDIREEISSQMPPSAAGALDATNNDAQQAAQAAQDAAATEAAQA